MNESSKGVILTPGTVLGGTYQIIRQIGQGGMGAVCMSYDTRLDLKVAIKVIAPENTEGGLPVVSAYYCLIGNDVKL